MSITVTVYLTHNIDNSLILSSYFSPPSPSSHHSRRCVKSFQIVRDVGQLAEAQEMRVKLTFVIIPLVLMYPPFNSVHSLTLRVQIRYSFRNNSYIHFLCLTEYAMLIHKIIQEHA